MNKEIVGALKRSFCVRTILAPFMNIKKRIEFAQYQKTKDHFLIQNFKSIHEGKRCFIIGNGPSLKSDDLNRLKGEITFATNGIYNVFDKTDWRPTYYLACDVEGLSVFLPRIVDEYEGTCFISNKGKSLLNDKHKNIIYCLMTNKNFPINTYNDKSSHISEDVSAYFSRGYSVTFDAIQLAIYMGCKDIYLIGVDFNYALIADKHGKIRPVPGMQASHFHETKPSKSFLNYYSTLYAYEAAEEYCKKHDIKIFNATRGGNLEVFERVNFDDVIGTSVEKDDL